MCVCVFCVRGDVIIINVCTLVHSHMLWLSNILPPFKMAAPFVKKKNILLLLPDLFSSSLAHLLPIYNNHVLLLYWCRFAWQQQKQLRIIFNLIVFFLRLIFICIPFHIQSFSKVSDFDEVVDFIKNLAVADSVIFYSVLFSLFVTGLHIHTTVLPCF